MGYILPVEHYGYQDYHKRVTQEKRNTQFIEGPYKVVLEKHHQEITSKYDRLNQRIDLNQKQEKMDEEFFSTVTGKGTHFSEKI